MEDNHATAVAFATLREVGTQVGDQLLYVGQLFGGDVISCIHDGGRFKGFDCF